MYQVEVKKLLVAHTFNPSKGWKVTVHLDPMELAKGGQHPPDKKIIAADCHRWLARNGVTLGAHKVYGRADFVATHPKFGTHVVEVEGDSSSQIEGALYSAFGQVAVMMGAFPNDVSFGIAFPDTPKWQCQAKKISKDVCSRLKLHIWLVSADGALDLRPKITK